MNGFWIDHDWDSCSFINFWTYFSRSSVFSSFFWSAHEKRSALAVKHNASFRVLVFICWFLFNFSLYVSVEYIDINIADKWNRMALLHMHDIGYVFHTIFRLNDFIYDNFTNEINWTWLMRLRSQLDYHSFYIHKPIKVKLQLRISFK